MRKSIQSNHRFTTRHLCRTHLALALASLCPAIASAGINATGDVNPVYDGTSDPWDAGSTLFVGDNADGFLTISGTSVVTGEYAQIARASGLTGSITVFGDGAELNLSQTLFVGVSGNGTLNVSEMGLVTSRGASIGHSSGSTGTATVSGIGTQWQVLRDLDIGFRGTGHLRIDKGGNVSSSDTYLGEQIDGVGTAIVTGPGSRWDSREIYVGSAGAGALTIQNGGVVTTSKFFRISGFNGNTGTVLVDGAGSQLDVSGQLALTGDTSLTVQNGGVLNSVDEISEVNAGASISINNGQWNHTGDIQMGAGTINVLNAGTINTSGDLLTNLAGAVVFDNAALNSTSLFGFAGLQGTGTISTNGLVSDLDLVFNQGNALSHQIALNPITGENITINLDTSTQGTPGSLGAGYEGDGSITIEDGRVIQSEFGYLGYNEYTTGTATVTGAGSHWIISGDNDFPGSTGGGTGDLFVGRNGSGTLLVENGGVVSLSNSYIGWDKGETGPLPRWRSDGEVTVTGAGSQINSLGDIYVGLDGDGQLRVLDGGVVNADTIVTGDGEDSIGHLLVSGAGSQLNTQDDLILRNLGGGTFNIEAAGVVNIGDFASIESDPGRDAIVTVTGTGSQWNVDRHLEIAYRDGQSILNILDGAAVTSDYITLGANDDSQGTILLTGPGSQLDVAVLSYVGYRSGTGLITVEDGAVYNSDQHVWIGTTFSDSNGTVTVTGPGSQLNTAQELSIGERGTGTLHVSNGATVQTGLAYVGEHGQGTATLTGSGTQWTNDGWMRVGYQGIGSLEIFDGAMVNTAEAVLGYSVGSTGTVTVDGLGSMWHTDGDLQIGVDGSGTLNIQNGGTVQIEGVTRIDNSTGSGVINFDNGVLNTEGLIAPNDSLLGNGTINTYSLVGDVDLVFDAVSGPQTQVVLNSLPGQNVEINYDSIQPLSVNFQSFLGVGYVHSGSITIQDGAAIDNELGYLGYGAGSVGVATVTGVGSQWALNDSLLVGKTGSGTLDVLNGGSVVASDVIVAQSSGSDGTVNVSGGGSLLQADTLNVYGAGAVSVSGGGAIDAGAASVYSGNGLSVDGSGSTLDADSLFVGVSGLVTVSDGAEVNVADLTSVSHYYDSGTGTYETGTIQFNGGTLNTAGLLAVNESLTGNGTVNTSGVIGDYNMRFDAFTGSQQQIDLAGITGQAVTINFDDAPIGSFTGSTFLGAGYVQTGSFTIRDAVKVNTDLGFLGYYSDAQGTATINGLGSEWDVLDTLYVGYTGQGTLSVINGGSVSAGQIVLAQNQGSRGALQVDGTASMLEISGDMTIGRYGIGTFVARDGANVQLNGISPDIIVGEQSGAVGSLLVTDRLTQLTTPASITVGQYGSGTFEIQEGAVVNQTGFGGAVLGEFSGSTGIATIAGVDSEWNIGGSLTVGGKGTGRVNIDDNAKLNVNLHTFVGQSGTIDMEIGSLETNSLISSLAAIQGTGTVLTGGLVSDIDLSYDNDNGLIRTITDIRLDPTISLTLDMTQGPTAYHGAGHTDQGSITIKDGFVLGNTYGMLGYLSGSQGTATITGADSTWNNTYLFVGQGGRGDVVVTDGGHLDGGTLTRLGVEAGSFGAVTVQGVGSSWTTGPQFEIGYNGTGQVVVRDGAELLTHWSGSGDVEIGSQQYASGTVTIEGSGSKWTNYERTLVGQYGNGALNILDGASVYSSKWVSIGNVNGAIGTVTVQGPGSRWEIGDGNESLTIGKSGQGTLYIADGAVVKVGGWVSLGYDGEGLARGDAYVYGKDTWLDIEGSISIGSGGSGSLTIYDGAIVSIGNQITIDADNDQDGSVNITTGGTLAIKGDGEASITDFYNLWTYAESPPINYWSDLTSSWVVLDETASDDIFSLNYYSASTGDLFGEFDAFGYTLLTVGEAPSVVHLLGDADGDGDVDAFDITAIEQHFGNTGDPGGELFGDADGDGDVDAFDITAVEQNFGNTSPASVSLSTASIPEPSSLMLLGVGGLLLTRRHRMN